MKKSILATEEEKGKMQIQDLSYDFANRIIRIYEYLTKESEYKEKVLSLQLLRSGTSIGANVNEAQHAQSDKDFLSKLSIALKEARETEYWLRLLRDNGYIDSTQAESLLYDCVRINKILIVIVRKISDKLQSNNK
ncbi:MAG: four helix bundle protein [Bacteroidaceae bacterium]|nr:four helix bundle protein [Bacteroidaceae bacterium]